MSRNHSNRRRIAWLLSLALFLVARSSGASWQCPNGTICPREHFQSPAVSRHNAVKAEGAHSCCQGRSAATTDPVTGQARVAPSSSHCVLRGNPDPPSRLDASLFAFCADADLWSPVPNAPVLHTRIDTTKSVTIFVPPYPLQTAPQRSFSSRGPPASR